MRATESLAVRPATRLAQPVVIGHRGAPAYRPEHTRRQLRAGDRPRCRADRARRRGQPGRRPRRPPRERAVAVHRRRRAARSSPTAAPPRTVDGAAVHRLVRRGLHPRRAAHPARGRADARAAAAEHRLRRRTSASSPSPRSSTWPARRSTADRPIRVLAELKHADWSTEHGLPMAELVADELRRLDATDAAGTGRAAVLRAGGAARRCAPASASDGPQMVQLVDDDADGRPDGHPRRAAGDLHLRPGHRPQPRAHPAARRRAAGRRGSALVDEAHRAALAVFCWTLRAGERLPAARTCAAASAPAAWATRSAEARQLLALGVDGLITDSPDHAVRAVAELADLRCLRAHRIRSAAHAPRALQSRLRGTLRAASPRRPSSIRSWMTTFSSRPGPTPITLIRAPESSSSRRT